MLYEKGLTPACAAGCRLAPHYVVPVLKARALQHEDVVRRVGVRASLAHHIADIHADMAPGLQDAEALVEDELHLLQVAAEVFGRAAPFIVHIEIGRAGDDELHGAVGHFRHVSGVADYNEVFLCHAHNYRAGYRLYFIRHGGLLYAGSLRQDASGYCEVIAAEMGGRGVTFGYTTTLHSRFQVFIALTA